MRKINLFIIVLLLSKNIIGQGYIPTIDTTNKWYVLMGDYLACGPETEDFQTHSLFFNGDSIYNSNYYHKLFSNYYEDNSVNSSLHYIGLIREDTINQKIYYIESDLTKENLIYDYTIEKGDRININYNGIIDIFNGKVAVVTDVAYITLYGIKRKRVIFLISDFFQYYWVEGIGSLNSLINLNDVGADYGLYNLNCFYSHDQLLYKNSHWDKPCIYANFNCGFNTISETQKNKIEIKQSQFSLTLESNTLISDINIYSIQGRLLYNFKPNSTSFSINTWKFESGLYILKINDSIFKIVL